MGTPEIIGVIISIINITFVSLALYAIIWYERFGSNQNRTLINQFVTSACWIGIGQNIFLQISEVIISFGFPMPQLFCAISLILKNTIIIHYALHAAAISVVKYLYIFVFKNPSDRNDTFWCFFINSSIFLNAFLSQFVLYFLPGKNPYYYYICRQTIPSQGLTIKINFAVYIPLVVSFVIYLYVFFKIKHYKQKVLPYTVEKMGQDVSLSNLTTLAIAFLTIMPTVAVAYILNLAPFEKQKTFPYNYLIQFHIHICPFLISLTFAIGHFMSSNRLRDIMCREFKHTVNSYLINCFKNP